MPPSLQTNLVWTLASSNECEMNATQLLAGIDRCGSMQAAPQAGFAVNEKTAAVLHSPHHLAKARCCTARVSLRMLYERIESSRWQSAASASAGGEQSVYAEALLSAVSRFLRSVHRVSTLTTALASCCA